MPRIQMPTLISDGSWITLTTIGEAAATTPSATAVASDLDQRPTTKARSESSNMSGSSCPERCATTTGTTTATEISGSGRAGKDAQMPRATTGTAARTKPSADDGSTETATTATARANSVTR